jgi:hypothetical protein
MDNRGIAVHGLLINTELKQNPFGLALHRAGRDLLFKERVRQAAILNRQFAAFVKFRPTF